MALSGHLLDSFSANLSINGPMSFNPAMHGSQAFNAPFAPPAFGTQLSYLSEDISDATAKKIAALQAKLNQKLGPEYISQRPGPSGGPKLTYAEGWKIINLANEVFGFNGWSSNVINITTDFIDYNEESRRYTVGVTAIIRVTLRDGVYHEDIGYGMLENSKSKGMAIDKCKKEAVTDGLKRALRSFGNLLGNCLYDKAYTQEVVKIKVTPPKFDASELHRRPECDVKPNIASSTNNVSNPKPSNNGTGVNEIKTRSYPTPQQQSKALPSLPPLMQRAVYSATDATMNTNRANSPQTPLPQQQNVLITPVSANTVPQVPRKVNDNRPQQSNQPSQRKVTFSDATTSRPAEAIASSSKTKPEPDDSFDEAFGYSEDDAFLASIDLGDIDLGRPIDDDGDAGRPIDYDEGYGDTSITNSHVDTSTTKSVQSTGNVGVPPPRIGAATGMLSGLLAQQKQRTNNHPPCHDENVRPNAPTLSNNKRAPIQPVGGFHFPPGMNPFEQNMSSAQHNQNLNARTGVKRPAESISTSYQSGAKRGMGLQNNYANNTGNGGREILGQLEIGEGGDVKRIKR